MQLNRTLPILSGFMLPLLGAIPVESFADDGGFYIGASGGQSKFFSRHDACNEILDQSHDALQDRFGDDPRVEQVFAGLLDNVDCDGDMQDTTLRAFVGYRANRVFAVEAGYIDFGNFDATLSSGVDLGQGSAQAEGQAQGSLSGYNLTVLLSVPFGERFGVFGKLGALAWDADASGEVRGTLRPAGSAAGQYAERLQFDDSGVDLNYGAGVRLLLTDNLAVRADWDRYETIDVETVSAGLEFYFK